MQHIQSERIKVYKSSNYKLFDFLKGNRPINDHKIKKIISEIDNGNDMLRYYPIQVREADNKLFILDGQHRFYLSKFFQRPVYYIIVDEEKKIGDIARVNSNVEKWKMDDFLNCYIKNGDANYVTVKAFMDQYHFGYSIALRLLSTGNPCSESRNTDIHDSFKDGTFKVKCLDQAVDLARLCELFKDSKIHTSKAFTIAIYRIYKARKISVADVASAYYKRKYLLTRQANYKGYVTNLEQIVNVGKQIRIVIL